MSSSRVKTKTAHLKPDFNPDWDIDANYKTIKRDNDIDKKFQDLANNINTTDWRSSDWYRAGYEEGKNSQ